MAKQQMLTLEEFSLVVTPDNLDGLLPLYPHIELKICPETVEEVRKSRIGLSLRLLVDEEGSGFIDEVYSIPLQASIETTFFKGQFVISFDMAIEYQQEQLLFDLYTIILTKSIVSFMFHRTRDGIYIDLEFKGWKLQRYLNYREAICCFMSV